MLHYYPVWWHDCVLHYDPGHLVLWHDCVPQVEKAVSSIKLSESLFAEGRLHDAFLSSQQAIIASGKISSLISITHCYDFLKPVVQYISMAMFNSLDNNYTICYNTNLLWNTLVYDLDLQPFYALHPFYAHHTLSLFLCE